MYYLRYVKLLCGGQLAEEVDLQGEGGRTLWITDSAQKARELRAEGEAVLPWLHEGNREENFSDFRFACSDPADLDREYLEQIFRRLTGLPWDILETEHCIVRETTVEDVDAFYRIYSDPSITRYMEALFEDPEKEREYTRNYIDKIYAFYGFGLWTVLLKGEPGEIIGRAGISYREGFDDPELGYVIEKKHQQKGYATEVCRAILEYGHRELEMKRILAFVKPENQASMKVCDKLSMGSFGPVEIKGELFEMRCHEENE